MEKVSLLKVSGVCAILTAVVAVAALGMLIVGTDMLDAEDTAEALSIMDEEKALVATEVWLLILANVLASVAGLGIFQALRPAGALMWIAVVAFVGGGLFLIVKYFTELAVLYELASPYVDADPATKIALLVLGETLLTASLLAQLVGDAISFGIGVPLFSLAILRTPVVPRWVGWLGFIVALGGWLALLGPASDVFEILGFIGVLAFFAWMIAVGVALLRMPEPAVST